MITRLIFLLLACACFSFNHLDVNVLRDAPTCYKGRFRPAEVSAKLWLLDLSNKTSYGEIDALTLLLRSDCDTLRLFWIGSAKTKADLGLPLKESRFSYAELQGKALPPELEAKIQSYKRPNILALEKGQWVPINALTQLDDSYASLAGTPYILAAEKALYYPSARQLKAERLYMQLPLIEVTLILYAAALLFLFLMPRIGLSVALLAFLLHTLILGARIYILGRPPVSNMFETVLYVPWIAVLAGFLIRPLLIIGTGSALALLIVLKLSALEGSLENVQAVLDSQYWLTVHVLMVVGSYGLFVLAGVLGHVNLLKKNNPQLLLKTLYLGIALLIPGTILGGVWAAESWGRFWDWDPKESWAFISSCVYLLVIHAYTFRYISAFGLAIGSIVGLMAISFTWYGVNYILGTGLHSYGFGSGGQGWYGAYILAESLFITLIVAKNWSSVVNSAKIKLGAR